MWESPCVCVCVCGVVCVYVCDQLTQMTPHPPHPLSEVPEPVRRIEVWLDDAHWSLTQDDGQLQVADIRLTNFR